MITDRREISGMEFCRRIRRFDSHTPGSSIPAIGTNLTKNESFLAGARPYVVKPASCDAANCPRGLARSGATVSANM